MSGPWKFLSGAGLKIGLGLMPFELIRKAA